MLPEAGIGLTYNFGLQPFLEEYPDHIDVLEVEPQTIWLKNKTSGPGLVLHAPEFDQISQYPCRKLLHGIGYPVGGSIQPGDEQVPLLKKMIGSWDVPWMSEHLSFNKIISAGKPVNTGFLLPPLQTAEGVALAAKSIRYMRDGIAIPLLIETGVNYLQPGGFEMNDGRFMASVAETADCGILLDLHNILVNEKNGRQPVREFIRQLPLERVYEIHLAGGRSYEGYYLDAHSGIISEELEDIARRVIRSLPNLKAVFFEIFPTYVEGMDRRELCLEMERIRRLWDQRGKGLAARHAGKRAATGTWKVTGGKEMNVSGRTNISFGPEEDRPEEDKLEEDKLEENKLEGDTLVKGSSPVPDENKMVNGEVPETDRHEGVVPTVKEWEEAVAALILKKDSVTPTYCLLKEDKGIGVMQELLYSFRASMVVRSIPVCFRYILLTLGKEYFEGLLRDYFLARTPEPFASEEALGFLDWLAGLRPSLRALKDLIHYESAVIRTTIDNETRVVPFCVEPLTLLRALAEKRLPEEFIDGCFELVIEGEKISGSGEGADEGDGSGHTASPEDIAVPGDEMGSAEPAGGLLQYSPVFHN